jgi:predicted amidophosphoribosyltransferase
MARKCPKCGAEASGERCPKCNAALPAVCPYCGGELGENDVICPQCGKPLAGNV